MKIYVASSWRNEFQPRVVELLREAGHEVYDFRNPSEGDHGFKWSDIDPDWESWTPEEYTIALEHPIARAGFEKDLNALDWAQACVYLLPCGRSASIEAGYMAGQGKPVIALLADAEPELMIKIFGHICIDLQEVINALDFIQSI